MSEEKIHVEDETVENEETSSWTEEFKVAGGELVDMVKKLAHEATVRRIVIKNEAKNVPFEVPLALGVVDVALLPVYAAIAMIAALVVDFTIMVPRV